MIAHLFVLGLSGLAFVVAVWAVASVVAYGLAWLVVYACPKPRPMVLDPVSLDYVSLARDGANLGDPL